MGCGVMAARCVLAAETEVRPLSPQLKTCAKCGYCKQRSEFHKHSKRADGLQVYCKSCKSITNREYEARNPSRIDKLYAQKALRRAAAEDYIRDHLRNNPCVDCGEDDWVVLEFDHVRGSKAYAVATLRQGGHSLDLVIAEIAKCDVRCCNCHRRVTYNRAGSWRSEAVEACGRETHAAESILRR